MTASPDRHDDERVLDDLLDELDATVIVLARLMSARHAECCESSETPISGTRSLVLRVLSEMGPVKAGDLGTQLGIKAPATTALVDALERDGLARRDHAPGDRRVTLIELTDTGRTALHTSEQHRREHMREYFSALTEDDVRTLIRIQRVLIETMSRKSSAAPATTKAAKGGTRVAKDDPQAEGTE